MSGRGRHLVIFMHARTDASPAPFSRPVLLLVACDGSIVVHAPGKRRPRLWRVSWPGDTWEARTCAEVDMNGDAVQVHYKWSLINSTWPVAQPRLARSRRTAVQKQPRLCPEPQNRSPEAATAVCPDTTVSGRCGRCLRQCVCAPDTGARHSRPVMSGGHVACLQGSASQAATTLSK